MTAFALTIFLEDLIMVSINPECAFTGAGKKIHIPTTEVLIHAAVGDLYRSNKLHNWSELHAVIIPPFFTDVIVLEVETKAAELLRTSAAKILEWGL